MEAEKLCDGCLVAGGKSVSGLTREPSLAPTLHHLGGASQVADNFYE